DLNYRPSLWRAIGGRARAQEVNRRIAEHVDVMLGNEEDFTAALGFEVEGVDEGLTRLEADAFAAMIERVAETYPGLAVVATTWRRVGRGSLSGGGALPWSHAPGGAQATHRERLEVLDRVGGGGSCASGLV